MIGWCFCLLLCCWYCCNWFNSVGHCALIDGWFTWVLLIDCLRWGVILCLIGLWLVCGCVLLFVVD